MEGLLEWWDWQGEWPSDFFQTVLLILGLVVLRWLVLRALRSRLEEPASFFRARKWIAYVVTGVGAIGIVQIWLGGVAGLGTYLGILSAGIAIALADVLESLAGWIFILLRRPFAVGDRVEIGGTMGDVVDIRAFRFSLLEIGNWVDADQSTGRIIHVPNGKIFSEHLANYSERFPYIWDEIPVLVTFESDWEKAEEIVRDVLAQEAPDSSSPEVTRAMRSAAHTYLIRYSRLTPTTYVSVQDSGVLVTARYLVPVRERRPYRDAIWRGVLRGVEGDPMVEFAYPTFRSIGEGTPRPPTLG